MLNKTIVTCCIAASIALVGCDQSAEMLEEQALELEAAEAEAPSAEAFAVGENPWEGLTFEEMAIIEQEDGLDRDSADFRPTDLAAAPDTIRRDLGCVALTQWQGKWVSHARARNLCPYVVSIKLIWRWGMDSYCRTLGPGDYYETNINNPAAYVVAIHGC